MQYKVSACAFSHMYVYTHMHLSLLISLSMSVGAHVWGKDMVSPLRVHHLPFPPPLLTFPLFPLPPAWSPPPSAWPSTSWRSQPTRSPKSSTPYVPLVRATCLFCRHVTDSIIVVIFQTFINITIRIIRALACLSFFLVSFCCLKDTWIDALTSVLSTCFWSCSSLSWNNASINVSSARLHSF